jgi:hypothetical protein
MRASVQRRVAGLPGTGDVSGLNDNVVLIVVGRLSSEVAI